VKRKVFFAPIFLVSSSFLLRLFPWLGVGCFQKNQLAGAEKSVRSTWVSQPYDQNSEYPPGQQEIPGQLGNCCHTANAIFLLYLIRIF
jgi:hypothetical protein